MDATYGDKSEICHDSIDSPIWHSYSACTLSEQAMNSRTHSPSIFALARRAAVTCSCYMPVPGREAVL